ncbi:hypothetical protein WJX72_011667 [[Myrmecia] bisecta]|uniref:Replication protein A 32 kDa subunit n=1 Tax=[Myrmecia] bisecta TaxID=41462 RepID=A0AAW1PPE1_9CHLO
MYSGYDAGASQFAGGGFMPSPAPAGDTTGQSPKKFGSQSQTLRAVTVKQLLEGTNNTGDDQYKVDGVELQNITLVGKLVDVKQFETNLTYILDDGTGKVEIKFWLDNDEGDQVQQRLQQYRVGMYVRAHGHVRSFQNQKSVVAFNLRAITDYNEVTYHLLQCVFQHVHLTKGASSGRPPAAAAGPTTAAPAGQPAAASVPATNNNMAGGDGMSNVQRDACALFNSPDANASESGISLEQVIGSLNSKYPVTDIRAAVDFLVNEGHIYTTVDDVHFKSTAF